MKTFEITEELVVEILNYLGSRPFVEVSSIISKLQSTLKVISDDKAVKPEPKAKAEPKAKSKPKKGEDNAK